MGGARGRHGVVGDNGNSGNPQDKAVEALQLEQADVEQRGSSCQDGNVVGDHEVAHAEVVGVGDLATEYLPLVSHRPVQGVVEQDNDGVERHESQNTVGPERLAVIAGILLNSLDSFACTSGGD